MKQHLHADSGDADLLEAFVERREQAAFEAIFSRYETLVSGVCRRILRDEDAARDATQAVFLALALKAHRLDRSRPLGPWLHRVAWDVAVSHRRLLEARRNREREATRRPPSLSGHADPELLPLLDQEINGLPERYRRALILFHLEGCTLEETAAALGCSPGTAGSWLFRGRRILRDRLARRGVTTTPLPAIFAAARAEAVPGWAARLAPWTAKAAAAAAAGQPAAGGYVSPAVWALARAAARTLATASLNVAAGLAAGLVAALALTAAVLRERPSSPPPPPIETAALPPRALPPDPVAASWTAAAARPSAVAASFAEPAGPALDAAVVAPESSPARHSDLVAHWPLDGARDGIWVEDRSGRGHLGRIEGSVAWVAGKIGRALFFDGRGAYVETPASPELEAVHRSSFSLSAWFRPENLPPGRESERDASYGILMRTGWHIGLLYNNEGRFLMTDWLKGDAGPLWNSAGTWGTTYAPGHWYHLVGVVDRGLGRVQLYVNGALKHTQPFDPSREVFAAEDSGWRIGIGNPDLGDWSWPARGAIDDVRIYNRPLSPTDVRLLLAESSE